MREMYGPVVLLALMCNVHISRGYPPLGLGEEMKGEVMNYNGLESLDTLQARSLLHPRVKNSTNPIESSTIAPPQRPNRRSCSEFCTGEVCVPLVGCTPGECVTRCDPTSAPNTAPSSVPSNVPSSAPSSAPSTAPSSVPSNAPSSAPSSAPSLQ